MEARAGITVEAVDARTGQPVGGFTVTVMSSTHTETTTVAGDITSVAAAFERPGIYTVTVKHPSYREWRATSVQVTRDECHVQPVFLKAELER
jgi:hypothetical protein